MKRWLVLIAVVALTPGCGWLKGYLSGSDNTEPPTPLTEFQQTLSVETLWTAHLGKGSKEQYVNLKPAVAYGRVFAATRDGKVAAYDVLKGSTLWEVNLKTPISGAVGVGEGLVLVGTSNAEILALSIEDGQVVWRVEVSSEILAIPQAVDNVVVVQTADGKIYALNAADGTRLWRFDFSVPALTLRGTSSPLVAQGLVVSGFANGKLVALDLRNGKQVWEARIAVPSGRSELERMVDIDAALLMINGVVYVASFQGRVAAVAMESGRELWERELSSYAGLAADAGAIYVTDDQGQVWALDRRTGAALWRQDKLRARAVTAPAVLDRYVVVGDFEGYVHWLDRDDGHFIARQRVDKDGILASPVSERDVLYVFGEGGQLAALRPGASP